MTRSLRYDPRLRFSKLQVFLGWFFVLFLPSISFYFLLNYVIEREKQNSRMVVKKFLMEEMERFRMDLDPKALIQSRLAKINQDFGFFDHESGSATINKVLPFSRTSLNFLKSKIENEIEGKVCGIFMYGPDTKEVLYWFSPQGKPIELAEPEILRDIFLQVNQQFKQEIAVKHQNFVAKTRKTFLEKNAEYFENRAMKGLRAIFGEFFAEIFPKNVCFHFYSKNWGGGHFFAYFSSAAIKQLGGNQLNLGGYLLIFKAEEIKPKNLFRFATSGIRHPGLIRKFIPEERILRPSFKDLNSEPAFLDVLPIKVLTFLANIEEVASSQKLAGNAEGGKRPTAGDEGCEFFAMDGIMSRSPGWASRGGFETRPYSSHPEGGRVPPFIERLQEVAGLERPFSGFLSGKPPGIAVVARKSAFSSPLLSSLLTLQWGIAIFLTLTIIGLVNWLTVGFNLPLNLGRKIGFSVSYVLALPMLGFVLMTAFCFRFHDLIRPEEIMDHLSRRLEMFLGGLDGMETFLSFRQSRLRDKLLERLDSSDEEKESIIMRWFLEGGILERENFSEVSERVRKILAKGEPIGEKDFQELKNTIIDTTYRRIGRKESDFLGLRNLLEDYVKRKETLSERNFAEVEKMIKDWRFPNFHARSLFFVQNTGFEVNLPDYDKLENRTTSTPGKGSVSYQHVVGWEKMLKLGGFRNLSPGQTQKIQFKLDLMHTLFDSASGRDWLGDQFKGENMFSSGIIRSTQEEFSTSTLYQGSAVEPTGVLVFHYLPNHFSYPYWKALQSDRKNFFEEKMDARIHYAIFRRPGGLDSPLKTGCWSGSTPNLVLIGEKAEETHELGAGRRWNLLKNSENAVYVSQNFSKHPYIGIGRAVPISLDEGVRKRVLGLMIFYPLLVILAVTAVLHRGFVAPIELFVAFSKLIGKGILGARLSISRNDEIGEVGEALNSMSQGLLERRRIARFVSEDTTKAVTAAGVDDSHPVVEKVEVTVLFSHIRDFSKLTEEHSPEEIVDLLIEYFTQMEAAIRNHGGAIDKFIEDAVMAVFRREDNQESHSERACRAALMMRTALAEMNLNRREKGLFEIDTGIGIASGDVISGRIGAAGERLDFTVIGNPVNLSARMESQSFRAKVNNILVAPTTIQHLKGRGRFSFVERVSIKGRSRTFPLYELVEMR